MNKYDFNFSPFKKSRFKRYQHDLGIYSNYSNRRLDFELSEVRARVERGKKYFTLESLILFSAVLSNFGKFLVSYLDDWVVRFSSQPLLNQLTELELVNFQLFIKSILMVLFILYLFMMIYTIFSISFYQEKFDLLSSIKSRREK